MKKDKKLDTLAVIDDYNFYDIHTHELGDSMTNPAQRAKLVKNKIKSLKHTGNT